MCGNCRFWTKRIDAYERYDRFDRPIGMLPASGVCMYPVPGWVGHPGTYEHDHADCLVCEVKKEDK